MEPVFQSIPLSSHQYDSSNEDAILNELKENSLKYQIFNKHEVKYLYNSLIDNCIYFLETTYESLYASKYDFDHPQFHSFAERVIRHTKITIPLLYSIMYYIKRFRTAVRKSPKTILTLQRGMTIKSPEDLKKVFVIAAVISIKFFNDHVIYNVEWRKFIDISVEEINLCENQFFRFIDYNLNLNVDNYYTFINDYLNKFRTKSDNFPTESYSSNKPKATAKMNENFTFTMNHPIISNSRDIPNTNTQGFSSSANNFLTITPDPSQSSPYNETTNNVVSPVKPLTPNDCNNNFANYYQNQNNGCYQPTQNVLYQDPVSMETSPQKQYSYDMFKNGNNNIQLPRNDTESTIYNNNNSTSYYPLNSPNSPTYDCQGNDLGNYRNNSEATLNNCNLGSTTLSPTDYSNSNVYHPSEDAILKEHLDGNNQIPLNKLLYHLHHYHMKQYTQLQNY